MNAAATRMLPSVDPQPGAVGDHELLVRLRAREESAFVTLIDSYGSVPLRIAMAYVPTRAVAEEVVQETWLGVLDGIDRFEGRSSLRTWILRIVSNIAKTRGQREGRSVPFTSLAGDDLDAPSFDADRFLGTGEWIGHWSTVPEDWRGAPEERLTSSETLAAVHAAIATLPPM